MNDSAPGALQRLVTQRMRELRRSYGDVARLGKLPRSTVHHLATHRHSRRLPTPATLEQLAGPGLPLNVVRAAAASAAGLVFGTAATEDPENRRPGRIPGPAQPRRPSARHRTGPVHARRDRSAS